MKVYKSLASLPQFKHAVMTIGTFDGVHKGHQQLIERIKQQAKRIGGESVLMTFHPHPRFVLFPEDKSLQLLNTIEEKLALLEQYGIDNVVVLPFSREFADMPALEYLKNVLVERFHPSCIVIGYDHHFGQGRKGNIELLKEFAPVFNYEIQEITKQTIEDITISSTKIRTALEEGNVALAADLLGHHYTLSGFVVKGQQIGQQINFPTANIESTIDYKLIPCNGVYAVHVHIEGKQHYGMLNIGMRPTFEGINRTIEVHILDFNADLYGENLTLSFIERIRNEQQFDGVEALVAQLKKDEQVVRSLFKI